jgi:hypothetical protein
LFFDISNFSADRTISFPNASGTATLNERNEIITGLWTFSANTVARDIDPNTTGAQDLGNTSKRWNNIWLANGLYMAGLQMIDGSRNIGNAATISTSAGGTITGHNITVNSGAFRLSNTTAMYRGTAGTDAIITSGNLGRFSSLAIGATYAGRTEVIDSSRNASFVNCDVSGDYKVDGNEVVSSGGVFTGPGLLTTVAGVGCTAINIYQSGWYFGVTGPTTFTTVDGKTVTVRGGVIISIV